MTRLLIADDHELVRETIAAYLAEAGQLEVIQSADLEDALVRLASTGPVDLVLLDYTMPGMSLPEGVHRAIDANAPNPVALLSGTASPDTARRALAAGAAGFLPKTMAPETLITAVRHLLNGGTYAPQQFLESDQKNRKNLHLTPRELDVLRGICEGKANKEIARDLEVQEVTIKLHVKTLCRKLNARNRTHAAMIGRDLDLL
ncbi:response regulator transcription factor [Thalassovita taeanensis]|uniref:Two component transcriptional regulator, LuxR family n=1 Tax=Thalassovita taeanensis TaxID=657014 RepID=A0A1H9JCG5_9RHOB|nr:response regulator transcription factor [Thalassovita taeanensis]SEQ84457.1 two component transcriptional regulator, LuxR family [Thalassovita taeanensis]